MSQFVLSHLSYAMWPEHHVGTPSKRAARDICVICIDAGHSSVRLGSHEQIRYHRYIRFVMGEHTIATMFHGDSFSKVVGA